MKVSDNAYKTGSLLEGAFGEARGLVEEFGIHVLLEVSLVGVIDRSLNNTVLSMIFGISIVEISQYLWRKRRSVL
jgi:hypothetical protein